MSVLAVFAFGLLYELLSVLWVRAAAARRALSLGSIAVAQEVLRAGGIAHYVPDRWLVPAYALGVGVGAYLGVRIGAWADARAAWSPSLAGIWLWVKAGLVGGGR